MSVEGGTQAKPVSHWDRLHIRSDRSLAVDLPDRPRRTFLSRGGFTFETTRAGHRIDNR